MKLGNTDITDVKLGSSQVSTIYRGTDLVWSNAPAFIGLLDTYPNAATAYSLRQLSSSYSGDAIRVRRASDNAELNIGFVDNELDTSALTTFATGTDAFVTTWYDQSGNTRNAVQATATRQPKIVTSGSVILDNTKPSMSGVNPTTALSTANFTLSSSNSFFNVNSKSGAPFVGYHNIFSFGNFQTYVLSTTYQLYQGTAFNTGLNFDTQAIISEIANLGTLEFFKNGTSGGTKAITFGNQPLILMGLAASTNGLNGKMQEMIIYDFNQSSNQSGIETNINTYYGIY